MATSGPAQRRFFTTTEVARYCEVSNDGVLKWIKAGKLRAFSTPGGHYRISAEDFRDFLTCYAFPIQETFFFEPSARPRARRVLIVDDKADQRKIVRRGLSELEPRWILDEADDGYDAGIKIGTFQPDVILLDLRMPHIDGLSLCRSIRSNPDTHRMRIIAMTGETGEDIATRAEAAGADLCMTKPIDLKRLRSEVARLFDRSAPRRVQPQHGV